MLKIFKKLGVPWVRLVTKVKWLGGLTRVVAKHGREPLYMVIRIRRSPLEHNDPLDAEDNGSRWKPLETDDSTGQDDCLAYLVQGVLFQAGNKHIRLEVNP